MRRIPAGLVTLFLRARPALLLLAVTMLLCWPLWVPFASRQTFPWDAVWEYWGDLQFQIDAYRQGQLPIWNPFDRCGYPFIADPQAGILYPLTWLLVALGALVGPVWWLVAVKIVFHLWWWMLGTYVWLRRRGVPKAPSAAAGAICVLLYPSTAFFSALNWPMAWTPWVLIAIDGWAESPSVGRGARLALALAMCTLAGAPAALWYTLLVAVPYGAWAWMHHRPNLRIASGSAVAAALLFGLMVAGQLLASQEVVPHTVRATRDLDFIAASAIGADDLLGLVIPRMPGQGLYVGVMIAFSSALALTLRPSGRNLVLGAISVGGVLLAIGTAGGWLPALASALPPATLFRKAHRYMYVVTVPLVALGAEGLAILASLEAAALRQRLLRWLTVGAVAGGGLFGMAFVLGRGLHFLVAAISWIVSAAALALIVGSTGARRRAFLVVAAFVLVLDVWYARGIMIGWTAVPRTPNDAEVATLPGVPLESRIYDRGLFSYRAGTRLQVRDFGGYEDDPLALRRYMTFKEAAYQDAKLLGHANVALIPGGLGGKRPLRADAADVRSLRSSVTALNLVAPAVAWYSNVQLVADEPAAFALLRRTMPGRPPIVERSGLPAAELAALTPLVERPATMSSGRITRFERNRMDAEVDADGDGVVVIAEAYHPGWIAVVDNQPVALWPVNGLFRGLRVGPGHHRIALVFHSGRAGWLMVAAPMAMIAAAVLALRHRRSRRVDGVIRGAAVY